MDKYISNGKAAVKDINSGQETAALALRKLGSAAEGWLAVDVTPKRTATEFADKVGTSMAQVSKGRKFAKHWSSDKAQRDACKAAGVGVTIGECYDLLPKTGNGAGTDKTFDASKAAASYLRSHSGMSRQEFDAFVREVRKSLK